MFFATDDGREFEPSSSSSLQGSQPCRHFEFPEIQLATHDFDESLVIGHGGFGKVYKGNVIYGSSLVVAAIKRLDSTSSQGAAEFWAEVEMLSKLRHCNLVSLIGYCNYGKEMILVYEYMPNGTLEHHLHKLGNTLSWLQRLKICIGAARGLHYLHTGTGIAVGVIHRDVKSSNILLHETWAAKISDFGLSRIGPTNQPSTYVKTIVKGTFGYFDPDYFFTGKLTRKSDVYAFGVVLLEVLCRKRAVDTSLGEEQWNLARWAQESIKEGNLKGIIDSGIKGQISPKCLKEFVRIAEKCLHTNPKQRSTMADVVVNLESVLTLQVKFNNSLRPAGRNIFGRMVDMLPFPFINGENSVQGDSKLSSNTKVNSKSVGSTLGADLNMYLDKIEVLANYNFQHIKELQKIADLRRGTSNLSQNLLLGRGYFGKVFLGWVDNNTFTPSKRGLGIAVALTRRDQGSDQVEWQAEVSVLRRLAHPNIISLLRYCNDEKHEYLLVNDYMHNQTFDRFLFPEAPESLSWEKRLSIMIRVARGLTYVHSSEVMYCNVESGDILLDQDLNAKPGDLWFARLDLRAWKTHLTTRDMDTCRYVNPGAKSDIYGFGLVLLENLIGQSALDAMGHNYQNDLLPWARPFLADKDELKKIIDPRLEQNYPEEGAFKSAALALRCLAFNPKDRPSSEDVLQSLEQIYALNK